MVRTAGIQPQPSTPAGQHGPGPGTRPEHKPKRHSSCVTSPRVTPHRPTPMERQHAEGIPRLHSVRFRRAGPRVTQSAAGTIPDNGSSMSMPYRTLNCAMWRPKTPRNSPSA